MKIIVDAFGGDNAPSSNVMGSVTAVNLCDDVEIILVGDKDVIQQELNKIGYKGNKIHILNAPDEITNDDVPTMAIRQKKESSLVVALDELKNNNEVVGMVSAGPTGAVLTGATLKIGRIKGVLRPAMAALLPTHTGKEVLLLDAGANVDSKPEYLMQFAHMGSIFMSGMYNNPSPKIGLLSVGTEDKKGNEFTKEVFANLKQEKNLNFVGNMEARDILTGDYDVVVADGFAGNVALKAIEGGINFALFNLKKAVKEGGAGAKFGYLFLKRPLKNVKNSVDYRNFGGAPFLGVTKPVIKSHGSSTAKTIYASILMVKRMHEFGLSQKLGDVFSGEGQ